MYLFYTFLKNLFLYFNIILNKLYFYDIIILKLNNEALGEIYMEIIRFNSIICTKLCKIQGYLDFTSEKKVTLIGRYVETKLIPVKNFYLTIFEDLEKNTITVKIPEEIYKKCNQFEKNCVYKIQGLLTIYSDQFSDSMKTYVQVKIDNIEEIKKLENYSEYTPDYQKLLNDKNELLSIIERKNESKIFSKDFITSKISNEEKINFLVLTSNLFEKNDKTSDILNDLYSEEEIKENIEKNEKQIEYNKRSLIDILIFPLKMIKILLEAVLIIWIKL